MIARNNHMQKMELKKQINLAAGLVSERFPSVSGIVIQMTYYQNAANPVLMVRTFNVSPASYAYFKMDCMIKGCVGGGFDLTSVVTDMVKAHKKLKKGGIPCLGNFDLPADNHARIEYEITMQYNKAHR